MPAPAGVESGRPSRLDRRKARTRRALLDAAREILVEHGTSDVSIQEITERADVGFGSFYNHFSSKTELFEAAVIEALEEHGAMLDAVTAGIEDPAEVFAVAVRATAHLADTHPAAARIMTRIGLDYLATEHGLAPRALRDIGRGIESGRFTVSTPYLGLVVTAGCLLAYLQVRLHAPELLDDDTADELVEQVLRMLGMNADSARAVAHRPLPQAARR
jgi:AcrR family transcriptional regulator